MHFGLLKKSNECPVCGHAMLEMMSFPRLPFTEMYEPWAPEFEDRGYVDQSFLYCQGCSHGKLGTIVPPKELYSGNYHTASASSIGAMSSLATFRAFIERQARPDSYDCVIDIGANDCSLLGLFPDKRRVAIDPNARGDAEIVPAFIEDADLADYKGQRKLILSSNTIEHVENPARMLEKLRSVVCYDDLCVFQFPSLDLLVKDARIDQIHHQHIHYFSLRSITLLLARYGFKVTAWDFRADHYGMLMVAFEKGLGECRGTGIPARAIEDAYRIFVLNAASTNARLERMYVIGYGAALMLPLFKYHIPNLSLMRALWDENTDKHGQRYINFDKRIEPVGALKDASFVVTAVSTKLATRKIVQKLFDAGARDVVVPLGSL